MEGFGGPAQPSPTIAQCLNGGYGWLEVMCRRCETRASIPLDAIHRPRSTPIWKLEAALKCRSCRTPRYAPPVRMIRLSEPARSGRMFGAIPTMIGEAAVKTVSAKPAEFKCPACNGTGLVAVIQSAKPGRRIYPPSCTKCDGKVRITKAAH
jgi:hypothetical protein